MKLTLALPSLNRFADESVPAFALPAFNRLLRYGILRKETLRPSEFYGRHLWSGSLITQVQRLRHTSPNRTAAFASPVWQQMGMHHVNIISGEFIGIQKEEAQRLCADLSAFYQDKDWQFEPLCESMWLLSMPKIEDWGAECVLDVCGQPEMDGQAHGKDAVSWLAMQTEIQMFLHTHPINQAREQQGLPEINGLWLWNDADGTQSADIVASDSAWARFSDTPKLDAPYDLKAWFEMVQETGNAVSDGLIFLDDLVSTLQTGDVWTYKDILESWETRWFAPLWDALASDCLKTVCIATDGENGGTLEIGRRSKWAFWRKAKTFNGSW